MKSGDRVTRPACGRVVARIDGMILVKWDDGTFDLDYEENFS